MIVEVRTPPYSLAPTSTRYCLWELPTYVELLSSAMSQLARTSSLARTPRGVRCLAPVALRYPNHMLVLYTDNSNVVAWLGTQRSPNPVVCSLVAAIECLKYRYTLKIAVRYIPSHKNRSADQLSRNKIPRWPGGRGSKTHLRTRTLARLINLDNLISSWTTTVNH